MKKDSNIDYSIIENTITVFLSTFIFSVLIPGIFIICQFAAAEFANTFGTFTDIAGMFFAGFLTILCFWAIFLVYAVVTPILITISCIKARKNVKKMWFLPVIPASVPVIYTIYFAFTTYINPIYIFTSDPVGLAMVIANILHIVHILVMLLFKRNKNANNENT